MEFSELRAIESWTRSANTQLKSMTTKLSEIEKALNENLIDPNDNVSIMELLESLICIQKDSKDIMQLLESTKTSLSNMETDLGTQMELLDKMFSLLKTNCNNDGA